MSGNQITKPHINKMCKSPTKNQQNRVGPSQNMQKSPINSPKLQKNLPEIANYEILNTNCTMIGSNNLNLDSKINQNLSYGSSQIKICSKNVKNDGNIIKKPQSPRNLQLESGVIHNITSAPQKFQNTNYNQIQNVSNLQNLNNSTNFGQNVQNLIQKSVQQTIVSSNNFIRNVAGNNKNSSTTFANLTTSSTGNINNTITGLNNGINLCNMSPVYSNASPNYPNNAVSPYSIQMSSPANSVSSISSNNVATIKSPVASPQNNIRPPTPQPILPQTFQQIPVMQSGQNLVQIIHAPNNASNFQNQVIARQTIIAPPQQNIQNTSPIIKIKPPQNILPKPPSSGAPPQGNTSKNSRTATLTAQNPAPQLHQSAGNPPTQIVLPNQTILPTAQHGTLLLNQMPLVVQQNTAHGVQLILRPSTPNSATNLATAAKLGATQNLILQPGPATASNAPQVILQHAGTQRGTPIQQPQQLVRVLTANGMLQPIAQTYIAMNNQLNIQQIATGPPQQNLQPQNLQTQNQGTITSKQQTIQSQNQQTQQLVVPTGNNNNTNINTTTTPQLVASSSVATLQHQNLLNVGNSIGQGNSGNNVGNATVVGLDQNLPPPKRKPKKKKKNKEPPKLDLGSIMKLSGIGDDDDVMFESDASESTNTTENLQQSTAQNIQKVVKAESPQICTTPSSESEINFIQKRITNNVQISQITNNENQSNKINVQNMNITTGTNNSIQQSLSDINAINQNLTQIGLINQSSQNFINNQILSTNTQGIQAVHNVQNIQNSSGIITQDNQNLANFIQAINHQGFSLINTQQQPGLPTLQPQKFGNNNFSDLNVQKSQQNFNVQPIQTVQKSVQNNQTSIVTQNVQNLTNTHFNLSNIQNAIPNIQVQNFCTPNNGSNLILNQNGNAILATPNLQNFAINNGILPNNLALPNTNLALPNFLPNLVQPAQDVQNFANNNLQRTGGFKLALSEDGRLILQHDPNLNQDIQSQMLLQSLFGINLQGGNLVLTSVNNQTVTQQVAKPLNITEPIKKIPELTKTTNIIQNCVPSTKSSTEQQEIQTTLNQNTTNSIIATGINNNFGQNPSNIPNNYSYIINLTPEQLEMLKRDGQLTVNGQTIFTHKQKDLTDKSVNKSPKSKPVKKKNQFEQKIQKSVTEASTSCSENMLTNNQLISNKNNQTIINQLQSPVSQKITVAQANDVININKNLNLIPATIKNMPPITKIDQQPKKIITSQQDLIKTEQDLIFSQQNLPEKQFVNGLEQQPQINMEQFLTNLNMNTTNLGQIISQKLGQELPNLEQKIVNITPNTNSGQLIAKIDISSENIQQFLTGNNTENTEQNLILPPLISMNVKQETETFPNPLNTEFSQNQLPALIIGGNIVQSGNEIQNNTGNEVPCSSVQETINKTNPGTGNNTVYQRIQTIQLTPQKQQLLKSVQLQIQALTAKLQQKNSELNKNSNENKTETIVSENEIHNTLRHLFMEQQKILATGKLLPTVNQPVTNLICNMETTSTQSIPVTTSSKTSTIVTSLLNSQPLVSQNQKVYYHHANQIIAINPTQWQKTNQNMIPNTMVSPVITSNITTNNCGNNTVITSSQNLLTTSINNNTNNNNNQSIITQNNNIKVKKLPTISTSNNVCNISTSNSNLTTLPIITIATNTTNVATASVSVANCQNQGFLTPNKISVSTSLPTLDKNMQTNNSLSNNVKQEILSPNLLSPKKCVKPLYSKAQLIEQQLTTDQNGANNPDINTPFTSKADACKRLVRYHCYNQPVLSQKDLDKADEIFEYTARHFIEKFRLMVNKYKYLLYKESMREVQTSELMMIDRMFLAEEQQSYLKLQSDLKLQSELESQEILESNLQDLYTKTDSENLDAEKSSSNNEIDVKPNTQDFPQISDQFIKDLAADHNESIDPDQFVVKTEDCTNKDITYNDATNTDFNIKLNYFSDDTNESSNFQVYDDSPKHFDEFIGSNQKTNHEKGDKSKNSGMESYNTTKIIGNFEIEINNKGCASQESYSKNFRQKIIDQKSDSCRKSDETLFQKGDEYDEWLCIQRELGYYNDAKSENDNKNYESLNDQSNLKNNSPDITQKSNKLQEDLFKKSGKRTASDSNRLETLKKFRVEKHNSKIKKSIIGEVKFEVRIEHKKVFPDQSKNSKTQENSTNSSATNLKRSQNFEYTKTSSTEPEYSNKKLCVAQNLFPTKSNDSYTSCQIKQEESALNSSDLSLNSENDPFDRSIDEQVQSAIDSILNLQQISSMNDPNSQKSEIINSDQNKSLNICATSNTNPKTNKLDNNSSDFVFNRTINDNSYSEQNSETLDEAVKSILS